MLDMMAYGMKLLTMSVFDINTYVGIVLGALFTPFFVTLYNYVKAWIIKQLPVAEVAIEEVEDTVEKIQDRLDPIVDRIEDKMNEKK